MANKNLGAASLVSTMLQSDSIIIEVGGSIRRITLDNFMDSINQGDEQLLRQVAWGIPIKQSIQSSPAWGRVGNLGMWEEYKTKCGRYLVTNDGKAAKLSVTNSGIYADGTLLNETKGNVMVISPRLYYLVKTDAQTNIPYVYFSQVPISGHFFEESVIAAYPGSMSGSSYVSRSGANLAPAKSITQYWQAAQQNGNQWGLVNYEHARKLMAFALSEYGNANIQQVLGAGVGGDGSYKDIWSQASQLTTGATKSLGDDFGKIDIDNFTAADGSQTSNSCRISLLGVEDWYGWQYQMLQGIYFGNSENPSQTGNEVFIYKGNRMPSSAELTTHPSGDYRTLQRLTNEGYITEEILGEHFDLIPKKLGGGSTSNWCDYFYGNTTGQLCLWGGHALYGSNCGVASVYSSYAFSDASSYFGSRLAYYGNLKDVDGKDIV